MGRTAVKQLGAAAVLALTSVGCAAHRTENSIASTQPAVPTYHAGAGRVFDASGFSIQPPEGYVSLGRSLYHFMNFVGPSEEGFGVNFNVNLQPDDGTDISLAAAKTAVVMAALLKDYVRIEDGFVTIDGQKAFFCSGTFAWEQKQCRNLQYFIRGRNGNIYVVTFASINKTFATHRPTFERAAMTARTD